MSGDENGGAQGGGVITPLRRAFPISFDSIEACLRIVFGPKVSDPELEKLQGKALIGLLAVGAITRAAINMASQTQRSDGLAFAALTVVYAGVCAYCIWFIRQTAGWAGVKLSDANPIGSVLNNVVSSLLVGGASYVLAVASTKIQSVDLRIAAHNLSPHEYSSIVSLGVLFVYCVIRFARAGYRWIGVAYFTATGLLAFLGFSFLINKGP